MPMEYHVNGQDGPASFDANQVVQELGQKGFNPQGVSADGLHVTLQDDQGPYQVGVQDVLKNLGWDVKGMTPQGADYENVHPEWRAAVHALPDDMMRKAYIEGQMKRNGIEKPQVVGNGRDWYVFNPTTSQYIAVTNSPGLNWGDAAEAAMEIPRMAGSIAGGVAGAAVGGGTPASIPLGAGGAGLGGGLVDTLERGGLALYDPEFRHQAEENMGAMAGDVGVRAGTDALATLAFGGIPKLAGLVAGPAESVTRAALNNGPLSTAAKGIGRGMEGIGGLANKLGASVDNPVGREFVSMGDPLNLVHGGLPGIGSAEAGGFMAQLPEAGVQAIPKVMGAARESMQGGLGNRALQKMGQAKYGLSGQAAADRAGLSETGMLTAEQTPEALLQALRQNAGEEYAQQVGGQMAGGLEGARQSLLMPRTPTGGPSVSQRLAQRLTMGGPRQPLGPMQRNPTSDVIGNIGEMVGNKISPRIGRTLGDNSPTLGQKLGSAGETFGNILSDTARLGRGVASGAQAATKGIVKGVRGAGYLGEEGGKALQALGTVGAPIENQIYGKYLSEENLRDPLNDLLSPWRKKKAGGTIKDDTTLASSY